MSLATDLQADINTFMGDLGQAMTLRRLVAGTYDVTTGTTSSDTSTDYVGKGRLGNYNDIAIDGTLVKQGDRIATFLPTNTAIVPQDGDRLVVGSDLYTVISFKRRTVGGTIIAYTLQVRE